MLPISSLPMGSTDCNPFEIETILRKPSKIAHHLEFINNSISQVFDLQECINSDSSHMIPNTETFKVLEIDCLKDPSLLAIPILEQTPSFKRPRIYSE